MSKRVRTLLRVSSKQQLHDEDIPLQRAEAENYIASRSEWVFDKEYIEAAVSAYKNTVEEREILQQILKDARNKEFDVLLTYMSDRIGRKEEYSFYVATLNNLGIEVWTIKDGQLRTEQHIDKLLNFIRFWQNEGESKKTSMRVSDAQRVMVEEGRFVGGKAPFGYRLVLSGEISNHGRALHKLEIVPENAATVQKIYSYAIHQGMGAGKIAKQLNAEGIPPITAKEWKSGTVSGILKNPIYMGYPAIGRRVNHGSFTSLDRRNWTYSKEQQKDLVIVSEMVWERAQEIREARKRKIEASKDKASNLYRDQYDGVPFGTSGKLALIGMVSCGYCGKKLKNASYNNRWYCKKEGKEKVKFAGRYQCPNQCRPRSGYSQEYLEGTVFEVVNEYLDRLKKVNIADEIEALRKQRKAWIEKEIQSLKKQKKTVEQDIATMNEKIPEAIRGEYIFGAEKLAALLQTKEEKRGELDKSIKDKEEELQSVKISSAEMQKYIHRVPNWKEEFASTDIPTRQMLLSLLIAGIEARDDDIRIRFRIRLEDFLPQNQLKKEDILPPATIHSPVSKQRL